MFSVASMTTDLIDSVCFDLTFTFDIFSHSMLSNYSQLIYLHANVISIFLVFFLFPSYTRFFCVRKGCIFGPHFLLYVVCPKSKCTDFLFNYLLDFPEITSYLLQSMALGKLHSGSNVSSTDHSSTGSHFP